jgi:hypothetical protein
MHGQRMAGTYRMPARQDPRPEKEKSPAGWRAASRKREAARAVTGCVIIRGGVEKQA